VTFDPRARGYYREEWAAFLRSVGIAITPYEPGQEEEDEEDETESDA